MFPGFVDLNDMNMNIMNNTQNMNNLNNMNMRMNDMNNFMNTMNMNDIDMNIMNIMNMNNMNTGLYNMNNMDNGFNNAYNINNNINNMNWNNINTGINNMNMNNMNLYMLNMNNINFELLKAFYFTMMMNNMNTLYTMINPYLFLMNQPNNNQITRFMPSRNQNDQIIIQNGGILPRTYRENNNRMKEDLPFPEYSGPRINIIFETGTGLKFNFPTPFNVPMKEVLLKYIRKVGVSESLLGNKIFFISNGLTIPTNEERTIQVYFKEYGLGNQAKIIVIDGSNVIGA